MEKTLETYGLLDIYYGTTSGNSRRLAHDFSLQAKRQGFLPRVIGLGDFQPEQFIASRLTFLFLSTYGTGGPTEDSERFYEWIEKLAATKQPLLKHLKYVIFGLGNTNFEFFAGMSKKVRAFLYQLGAEELHQFTTTDAKVEQPDHRYGKWKEGLLEGMVKRYPQYFEKKSMTMAEVARLSVSFTLNLTKEVPEHWEEEALLMNNLQHDMKTYLKATKLKVLEIREIRQNDETRSTLFVRLEKGKLELTPACNVQLYPLNIVPEHSYVGGANLGLEGVLPFPPMPLRNLVELLNVSQRVPKSFLQNVLMSSSDQSKVLKYEQLLQNEYQWQQEHLTAQRVIEEFKVPLEQQISLGINTVRVYTLAGWSESEIQLLISLYVHDGKLGLASKYLSMRPQEVRLNVIGSSFSMPKSVTTPIIMVANGSGMAPFRSIVNYYKHLHSQNQPINPLVFFFGCQKLNCDYYFRGEWEQLQKQGIVKMRVATSRQGEQIYVQKLLEKNEEEVKHYLLEADAVFFVCGSEKMGREFNNVLINIIKRTGSTPYAAMNKVKGFEKAGRIVKEIYG